MNKNNRIWLLALVPVVLLVLGALFLDVSDFALLDAKGEVAQKERNLLIVTAVLGLLVVVPVFVMTYAIAWRYRETNTKAKYRPDFDHNIFIETIWWTIPCVVILALAAIAWNGSHELDPTRKLASNVKPLRVQVVALQWRWLFIYPEQDIAALNYVQFPEKTPIDFDITSDAPMNSFWIPQLGGQIYAMAGMSTQLHLMADQTGVFRGSSANISGEGFAGMTFEAKSVSRPDFETWVDSVKQSPDRLSIAEYLAISKPSKDKTIVNYASSTPGLYSRVLMKYMMPEMDMRSEAHHAR